MTPFNPLVRDTGSPPIPEAQAWTRRYDGSRGPLIDLSQAVPGYPPHPDLLARLALEAGSVAAARYGDIYGDEPLRRALADDINTLYRGTLDHHDVMITSGCNQAFVLTMMSLAKAGDNVIVPSPWYFNHQMTLDMLGVEPRALACRAENSFVPSVEDAEQLINQKTRAIILVTPNNPTGAIYPSETLAAFLALAQQKNIWLVIDETYRDFLNRDEGAPHDLFMNPAWRDHVISLYSFSKSYCVPGHRVGAIMGGQAILEEVRKVIDCVQICAPRAAQAALAYAIPALGAWRQDNTAEITRRAHAFRAAITSLNGWKLESIGAYFAYVAHPFKGQSARVVAESLAAHRGVLGLPGPYFGPGQEGHLRLAFANVGVESINELPSRLADFTL